jgi:hypothetical protein
MIDSIWWAKAKLLNASSLVLSIILALVLSIFGFLLDVYIGKPRNKVTENDRVLPFFESHGMGVSRANRAARLRGLTYSIPSDPAIITQIDANKT